MTTSAGWTKDLLAACQESCAEFGDPPCLSVEADCGPCADCLKVCGFEVVEPIDPAAVVAPLL